MIVINWRGAYFIRDGEVEDSFEFPEEKADEILDKISHGDLSPISEFIERHPGEEIKISSDIRDVERAREIAIALAKRRMKNNLTDDYILEQILAMYDDLVSTINLLSERNLEMENLEDILGGEIEEADLLRREIDHLISLRNVLSGSIEKRAREIAPNLSHLVGPIIASRLIHYAGGLKRLAMMPSSTIQVLGAEDAFFQHLKKGTPCPKHGIIFQVAEIRNSPRKLRGKIARALAGKIAIAARVDYYGGEFIAERLKEEFKRRVEEIRNDSRRKS